MVHARRMGGCRSVCEGEYHQRGEGGGRPGRDSGYFSMDELPPLAEDKNTKEQIAMCFEAAGAEHWKTQFD